MSLNDYSYSNRTSGISPTSYLVQDVLPQYGTKEGFTRVRPSVAVLPLRVVCCSDYELLRPIEWPAKG